MLDIKGKIDTQGNGQIAAQLDHFEAAGGGHQIASEFTMFMYQIYLEIAFRNQMKVEHKTYDDFSREVQKDVTSMVIDTINLLSPNNIEALLIESIKDNREELIKKIKLTKHEDEALPSNDQE